MFNTLSFVNKIIKIYKSKELLRYYGLYKKDNKLNLVCLYPKVAIDSLMKNEDNKPLKLIFTSATLPDVKIM